MLSDLTKSFQKPVLFDHDGSVDDFVALITLLTLSDYKISGITVTGGNCILDSAVETTLEILSLFCRYDVEVCKSNAKPKVPFPQEWQEKNHFITQVDILKKQKIKPSQLVDAEAHDFLAKKILAEKENVTIVMTGPSVNVATMLEKYLEVHNKIDRILWMGGAFLSDGNVIYPDHDGSAEWNIFWDPSAALSVLKADVTKLMFPLDVSYMLPVDNYLMFFIEKNTQYKLSSLVYQLFKADYEVKDRYYMFDVLPVVYLGAPDLFHFDSKSVNIEQRGTSKGNIYRTTNGYKVKQAKIVDEDSFYEYFIKQLTLF
ncbi:MAG: nucleoside hydrolase [Prolixibacteraceae bacterium]|nr:nucleoside hydrolase [Prolixibacteraceae bacterium]